MKDKASKVVEKGTKERIRDVAIDLFSREGYNAVSIRDIARVVKITESSIYNHYKGKEDIIDSIIDFLITTSQPSPNEVPMDVLLEKYGPEGLVMFIGKVIMERLKVPHIRKICRFMCIELYHNVKIQDFFKNTFIESSYQSWEQIFQKMMDMGLIRKHDAKMLATEFFDYCIFLYFDCFIINYDEAAFDALIDSMIGKLTSHVKFLFGTLGKTKTGSSGEDK